jgi:hypothetical protein
MEAMAERERTPLWMNLDYLSAEDWVGLSPSALGEVQGAEVLFFPGFPPGTGGLLREAVAGTASAFQQDVAAQQHFLQGLGVFPHPARG